MDVLKHPFFFLQPVVIANLAATMAEQHGLQCSILGDAECRALGMGGFLGVQQVSVAKFF